MERAAMVGKQSAEVAQRVAQALSAAPLTQAEIARELGMAESTISRLKNCRMRLSMPVARKLAGVLPVSASFLLFGEDAPKASEAAENSGEAPEGGYNAAALNAWHYCPACGVRLEDDWRFCAGCGRPVQPGENDIEGE